MGLSIIPIGSISIDKNGKKVIKYPISWRKYQKQKPTEDEVIEWFEQKQYSNIGIITGKISELFVLDCDSYKEHFDKKLFDSFQIPITPVQTTARGGKQYFFHYTGEARNATGILKEDSGMDIRANGGMVIAPPTITSYGEYTWEIPPEEEMFAPLPPELEKLFAKKERKNLQDLISLNEGSRDDSIASLVGRLSLALPQRQWLSEIWPTIQKINETYKPPLPKQDLVRIYRSITQKELARRGEKEEKQEDFAPSVPFASLMETEYPDARYAIEPFFEAETINMVSAPPNTWKSWLLLLMAASMANGVELFEKFKADKLPVMIVNEEDSARALQERMKLLGIKGDLPIWFRIMQGAKLEKEYIERLLVEMKEKGVKVVFFDSLRAVHNAEENDSTAMQEIMDLLKLISREGITVIFTHHHRKKTPFVKNNGDPEASRGSSAINAAVSGHISLEEVERENKKYIIVRHLKSKVCEKIDPFEIEIDTTEGVRFTYYGLLETQDKKLTNAKNEIYALLDNNQRWISTKEIVAMGFASERTTKTALAELRKEENVTVKTRKELLTEGVRVDSDGKKQENMYFVNKEKREEGAIDVDAISEEFMDF